MAQRTETELKVFLEGTLKQYNELSDTDKAGSVFFDKTNHAVYAKGECIIKSNVASVELVAPTGSTEKTIIKLTYFDGQSEEIDTAIPDIFVRFNGSQSLSGPQKEQARANIGAEAADATILKEEDVVNNLTTNNAKAPLSAEQGKELKRQIDEKVDKDGEKVLSTNDYTTTEKNKLATIEEGAQKNVINSVQAADEEASLTTVTSDTLKLMGNLMSSSDTDIQDGKISYNFSARYDNAAHKIYFFNTADAPETGLSGKIAEIDATQFIKDGVVDDVTYNPDTKILTISFNTSSGKQDVPLDLTGLVDTYTAGDGLTVANNQFSANLGNGLQFDNTANNKKITLKLYTKSGLNVTANGLAVNNGYGLVIEDNNEIAVDIDTERGLKWTENGKFGVDFTKAPVQSVNGQTGVVKIDVTPKVWSF